MLWQFTVGQRHPRQARYFASGLNRVTVTRPKVVGWPNYTETAIQHVTDM